MAIIISKKGKYTLEIRDCLLVVSDGFLTDHYRLDGDNWVVCWYDAQLPLLRQFVEVMNGLIPVIRQNGGEICL